jgi:hypothetical protein
MPDSAIFEASIILHQHNETNVMHFSFNLLGIKGLYMFRALLAPPQEVLHSQMTLYAHNTKFRLYSAT